MQIGRILQIARMQFLVLALALFIFGSLVAVTFGAPFSWARLLLGSLIVLSAQLSVHFSNDYFDVDTDQIGGATLVSGGSGVLLEHPELRETSKQIAIGLILFSFLLGIAFLLAYEMPAWFMGLVAAGNLVGWIYSAPPFRLAYRGLGELCSIFVVGFLVPVTGYVVMKSAIDGGILVFLPPILLYGLVLILTVEIPDLEVDRLGGKRNWIARFGRRFGFTAIGLSLLAASAYFFLYPKPLPVALDVIGWLSLLALVPGVWGWMSRPLERGPATRIAIVQIFSLAIFTFLVNSYLFLVINF